MFKSYNADSKIAEGPIKLGSYVDVPVLVWSTGCKFFGADYGMAIAQPFDWTNLRIANGPSGIGNGTSWLAGTQWGTYNTVLVPFILSWKWCDFRIKAAMDFGMNDGTTSPGDSVASITKINTGHGEQFFSKHDGNPYAWASNDNWQFTPNLGISWLHAGWNFSADFFYTWYTKDTDTNYQNGDEFSADYTITYTCGKWTFGLGAEQQNQVQNDKFDNGTGFRSQPGTSNANYTMGPIVGYNFGPCSLMFTYNFALSTTSDVGGDWWNLRLVVPLGNPCPIAR